MNFNYILELFLSTSNLLIIKKYWGKKTSGNILPQLPQEQQATAVPFYNFSIPAHSSVHTITTTTDLRNCWLMYLSGWNILT